MHVFKKRASADSDSKFSPLAASVLRFFEALIRPSSTTVWQSGKVTSTHCLTLLLLCKFRILEQVTDQQLFTQICKFLNVKVSGFRPTEQTLYSTTWHDTYTLATLLLKHLPCKEHVSKERIEGEIMSYDTERLLEAWITQTKKRNLFFLLLFSYISNLIIYKCHDKSCNDKHKECFGQWNLQSAWATINQWLNFLLFKWTISFFVLIFFIFCVDFCYLAQLLRV